MFLGGGGDGRGLGGQVQLLGYFEVDLESYFVTLESNFINPNKRGMPAATK